MFARFVITIAFTFIAVMFSVSTWWAFIDMLTTEYAEDGLGSAFLAGYCAIIAGTAAVAGLVMSIFGLRSDVERTQLYAVLVGPNCLALSSWFVIC